MPTTAHAEAPTLVALDGWQDAPVTDLHRILPLDPPRPTEWIIENQMPERSVGMLYGESGSRKSFYAIAAGMSVAAGRDFFGCRVRKTPVLYFYGEGGDGIASRARAYWHHELGAGTDVSTFYPVDGCPNVLSEKGLESLVRMIRLRNAGLVIIDTLARSLGGAGNENSNATAGRYMDHMQDVAENTGCTVLLIHHASTKSRSGAERGASGWRAACDFMLSMTRPSVFEPGRVAVTKQKGARDDWYAGVQARVVVVPGMAENQWGGGNTSLVVSRDEAVQPPITIGELIEEQVLDLIPATNAELSEVIGPLLLLAPTTARDKVAAVAQSLAARGWISRPSQKAPWAATARRTEEPNEPKKERPR